MNMNTKTIEKNWTELKGKIKSKWGKFSDVELESFKGNLSQLAGKIQTVYGITVDHADRQYEEFKKSVQSLIGNDASIETPKADSTVIASADLPKPNLVATPQAVKAVEPAVVMKESKVG